MFEFLDLHRFVPADLMVIATLILLESLLSCDNAVALAMIVRRLPAEQQGRALRYGIIGAYVFLFIALCLATWIVQQWWLKLLGGAYLLWIAGGHFLRRPEGDGLPSEGHGGPWRIPGLSLFWATVVTVELTDIAFSVDSIAAAVAFSDKFFVLLAAGMVYILAMRFAAQGFIALLRRFPGLETAAFIAVAVIGAKLCLEMPADLFRASAPNAPVAQGATFEQWRHQAEIAHDRVTLVEIPFVITVASQALERPAETGFASPREAKAAQSHWNLHHRSFIHLEATGTAAVVLLVFAGGLLHRRRRTPEPPGG